MDFTFIEALAKCRIINDFKSEVFLEYILLKYFDNNSLLNTTMRDASCFLAQGDLEDFLTAIESLSSDQVAQQVDLPTLI